MIVKVCGMRNADNIRAVEQAGADWMGFIFHPRSPRYVPSIPTYLPKRCKRVGVFVDADPSTILQKVQDFGLHLVQLHGNESPAFVRQLHNRLSPDVQIIKMIPLACEQDLQKAGTYVGDVAYFLFETKKRLAAGYYGGSGQQFDWQLLEAYQLPTPFLITGGIGPDDVVRVRQLHLSKFAGVDINSRFETTPAVKDVAAIKTFIKELTQNPQL